MRGSLLSVVLIGTAFYLLYFFDGSVCAKPQDFFIAYTKEDGAMGCEKLSLDPKRVKTHPATDTMGKKPDAAVEKLKELFLEEVGVKDTGWGIFSFVHRPRKSRARSRKQLQSRLSLDVEELDQSTNCIIAEGRIIRIYLPKKDYSVNADVNREGVLDLTQLNFVDIHYLFNEDPIEKIHSYTTLQSRMPNGAVVRQLQKAVPHPAPGNFRFLKLEFDPNDGQLRHRSEFVSNKKEINSILAGQYPGGAVPTSRRVLLFANVGVAPSIVVHFRRQSGVEDSSLIHNADTEVNVKVLGENFVAKLQEMWTVSKVYELSEDENGPRSEISSNIITLSPGQLKHLELEFEKCIRIYYKTLLDNSINLDETFDIALHHSGDDWAALLQAVHIHPTSPLFHEGASASSSSSSTATITADENQQQQVAPSPPAVEAKFWMVRRSGLPTFGSHLEKDNVLVQNKLDVANLSMLQTHSGKCARLFMELDFSRHTVESESELEFDDGLCCNPVG